MKSLTTLWGIFCLAASTVDAFSVPVAVRAPPATRSSSSFQVRFATVPEKDEKVAAASDKKDFAAEYFNQAKPSLWEGVPYSDLTIGVLKEDLEGENRVSQTPDSVKGLVKAGFTVVVEEGGESKGLDLGNFLPQTVDCEGFEIKLFFLVI